MAGKKILVVDDEADNRTTVKTVLEKEGYIVETAINGDDALKKWKANKPALVVMDIMMPGTPVKEIIPKMTGTKVVYLSVVRTSEAEKEDLMKSKNIVGFIQKPFDIKDLVTKVKKLVS
jgi:CheY-like chemotaxis protein